MPRFGRMQGLRPREGSGLSAVGEDPQLLDVWLAEFVANILDSFAYSEELGDFIMNRLPDRTRLALNRAVTCFDNEGAAFDRSFLSGVAAEFWESILGSSELEPLQRRLEGVHRPNFPEFLDLLAAESGPDRVRDVLKGLLAESVPCPESEAVVSLQRPLDRLAEMFTLKDGEVSYLMYLYCRAHDAQFDHFCDFSGSVREIADTARVLGIGSGELRALLLEKESLRANGLISVESGRRGSSCELDPGVDEFLGGTVEEPFQAKVEPVEEARFPLESFPVDREKTDTILGLLSTGEPRHILVHGTPGAGKTEYVRALVARNGVRAHLLRMGKADEGRTSRLVALAAVTRIAAGSRSILVLDECDDLLATEQRFSFGAPGGRASGKEWLNEYLDGASISTIWIANDIDRMHESVKRRFSFSLRFEPLPVRQRLDIWARLAKEAGLPALASDPEAQAIVRAYSPSPADMAGVLAALEGAPEESRLARLRSAFQERRILLTGRDDAPEEVRLPDTYDLGALDCSVPPADLAAAVTAAARDHGALSLLFHGAPGTGKTELARYIARSSGYALMAKRASDILSPYLGMTEQKTAGMFHEAERSESILLLDEADSFFQDRRFARHGWEISQVNEFLTQLERFKGVFIACTNFLDRLDRAALRRFAFKVEFSPPGDSGLLILFERYFPGLALSGTDRTALCRIPGLSPGDFKAVGQMRAAIGTSNWAAERIIGLLGEEAGYRQEEGGRKRVAGFTA